MGDINKSSGWYLRRAGIFGGEHSLMFPAYGEINPLPAKRWAAG